MARFFELAFAWSGGGLFVASLAFCAYTYVVGWSATTSVGGWTAWVGNSLLIGLFAAHHSLFARDAVKRSLAAYVPDRLLRSTYVWAAALLLIMVCVFWRPVAGELYHMTGWLGFLLGAVQLLGLWVIARSVATIDPLDLAGIRQVRSASTPLDGAAPHRLQVVGPYRFVRHPLYFGWVLATFGAPHLTGNRLAFAVLTTIYLVVAIPWEERSLTTVFGRDYERYKEEVRWRMLPYVY